MDDVALLRKEIETLRDELSRERELRISLEGECDALAAGTVDLQKELADLRLLVRQNAQQPKQEQPALASLGGESSGEENNSSEDILLGFDGDGHFADKIKCTIENACGSANVLSVSFCTRAATGAEVLACGGADNCVSVYDTESGTQIEKFTLSAPVLMLDAFGSLLACSMMDGSAAIIDVSSSSIVSQMKDHTKYVVGVKWNSDGRFLATVSHDKSVNLYKVTFRSDGSFEAVEKSNTLRLTVTPESLCFVSMGGSDASIEEGAQFELIIALRDTNHLIYLNCTTFAQRLVSVNENHWDTHVSLTPLFLTLSPDSRHLLVATDKNMHYLTRTGQSKRVKIYAGHNCGDYGRPRLAFDCTGQYFYSNSENDSSIFVYDTNSALVVGKLSGHHNIIKDVCCSKSDSGLVATASFDHSVIVWHRKQ